MSKKFLKYDSYFSTGQQVKLGHSHPDRKGQEINGEIIELHDKAARVEIIGAGLPSFLSAAGAEIFLSGWSGWGFYICKTVLENTVGGKEIELRLSGKVEEYQRREYFRWDVAVPVQLSVPDKKHQDNIREFWTAERKQLQVSSLPVMRHSGDNFKVAGWKGGDDILPREVNLSGGGIRMKTGEYLAPGTIVRLDIFLPLAPARVIAIAAEVLRCNEISLRLEKDPLYNTAMKFIHIDDKDRETIISYLFAEQRKSLQTDPQRNLPEPHLR